MPCQIWSTLKAVELDIILTRKIYINDVCIQISLRWRTSDEVLSGKGESTCSNLRCLISNEELSTFHLPFTYEEENIVKSTDVKIKVCKKCSKKLNYKSDLKKKKAREEVSYESRRRKYEWKFSPLLFRRNVNR